MLSETFIAFIGQRLKQKIVYIDVVSGGNINAVYCLHTLSGKYLVKVNSKSKFPDMFLHEATGLNAIASAGVIATPGIICFNGFEDDSFLLLEWINIRKPTSRASALLGNQLAQLHGCTAATFGFDSDNYMGSMPQSNRRHNKWSAFFIQERLQPMVKLATSKGLLTRYDVADFETLYTNLPGLFNEEIPALIHGDLWGGNYLIADNETPYLIDPAVCYGNREFDIAMTTLFGGFSTAFYDAYQTRFPLAKGWEQRVDLWNLYPLLLHLNLFGTGYLGQVRDCLRHYI